MNEKVYKTMTRCGADGNYIIVWRTIQRRGCETAPFCISFIE